MGHRSYFLTLLSRADRVAKDKLRVDDNFAARVMLFAAVANHVIKNNVANLLAWDMVRGERRRAEFGQLNVVKAGDGNITRDLQAFLAQRTHHSDGHKIIDAKNNRWTKTGFEHLPSRLAPTVESIGSSKNLRVCAR